MACIVCSAVTPQNGTLQTGDASRLSAAVRQPQFPFDQPTDAPMTYTDTLSTDLAERVRLLAAVQQAARGLTNEQLERLIERAAQLRSEQP